MERKAPGLSPDSPPSSFRSSASSSSLSSSFRAESFDFSVYPPQSEYEEAPSFRWLPSPLRPATASTSGEGKSWSEGYIPLCKGHGSVSGGSSLHFKDSHGDKCLFLPASGLMVREDEDQLWRCTDAYENGKRWEERKMDSLQKFILREIFRK